MCLNRRAQICPISCDFFFVERLVISCTVCVSYFVGYILFSVFIFEGDFLKMFISVKWIVYLSSGVQGDWGRCFVVHMFSAHLIFVTLSVHLNLLYRDIQEQVILDLRAPNCNASLK